jgi:ubiquinone biosynthesis protein COQ9
MNGEFEMAAKQEEFKKKWSELMERKRTLHGPDRGSNEQMIEEMQILQGLADCGYSRFPDATSSVVEMLEVRQRVLQERRDKYA